jgi:uncharacterized protein (TIGR03437 family)
MRCRAWLLTAVLAATAATTGWAATFGKVVSIGGHAADLALDEGRGVLYVANFTAHRVEVISLSTLTVRTSMNVAAQPSSLALSRDGKYLVIAHYGDGTGANALTVIELDTNRRRTYALPYAPLGLAIGADDMALVATAKDIRLFDPARGTLEILDTIASLNMKVLPQPAPIFPPEITSAAMAASRDGNYIYGLTDNLRFGYEVNSRWLQVGIYTATPKMGPRTVSVSDDGSVFTGGWALFEGRAAFGTRFSLMSQFEDPKGELSVGGHAIDSSRGVIYAQVPESNPDPDQSATPSSDGSKPVAKPVLRIVDGDNLAVLERLQLAENLAGKSVMSRDYKTLYSISDSGITVFPVGSLDQARRIRASQEDVVFRGNYCDNKVATQEILIEDLSGAATDFQLSTTTAGIKVVPTSGTTPARIRITVDPAAFLNQKGTVSATLNIKSSRAVNLPDPVRLLINTREPDQRGTMFNVPGRIVDILADPARDRFYLLRQDKNQVLVFDSKTLSQIATLKTGNTPTQMAITFDRRYMLVGADNSQLLYMYDLETLQPVPPLRMPGGHYPRSVASAGAVTLVANRVAGPTHAIDRVDLFSGTVTQLSSLGIYENDIDINTTMVASPNGSSILIAQANGTLMLFNTAANTFTVARNDEGAASGAIAASNYDQFVVGNNLLNSSLVPIRQFDSGTSQPSGFAFVDQGGFMAMAADAASAGVMAKIDTESGDSIRPTRLIEAPVLGTPAPSLLVFTRTLAPLRDNSAIVALTTSGFTVFPWNYDAAFAPPRIDSVLNAADRTDSVAPGGLISIMGSNLSPTTESTTQAPLPTILGESCLTVNGMLVPMVYVSSRQVNAQLPPALEGNATLLLHTPGGISDNFNLTIKPVAPSVFHSTVNNVSVPLIVREKNGENVTASNPIHLEDRLSIFATGLGPTTPEVPAGTAAPADPPASVIVSPTVTLGGVPVQVTFAGLNPGDVGVYRIDVYVNGKVPTGWNMPLEINQADLGSTSIDVRVVR